MSTPTKLRGGSNSELTRLKTLWLGLSDDARDFWRSRFASAEVTQAQIRGELHTKLKVNLRFDSQLTKFRDWMTEQDLMDREAERQAEEETRLRVEHPDWDADRLRSEVIASSMRRALATGDLSGLGLKAVKAAQQEKQISLDRDKFELLKQKAEAFDQAKQVVQSQLSPEEQKARLKEILK